MGRDDINPAGGFRAAGNHAIEGPSDGYRNFTLIKVAEKNW
jgi:hypothetical protein